MDIIKRNKIIKALSDYEPHNITELADEIQMPRTSLVRYLSELTKDKKIEKSRSNVTLLHTYKVEDKAGEKYKVNSIVKNSIASKAAKEVKNKDIIFIDGGSTNIHLLQYLANKDIIIYTNNISLVEMINNDSFKPKVFVVPGELYKPTSTIIGSLVVGFLSRVHIDKAFLGTNAVVGKKLLTTNQEEAVIKSSVISQAKKTFVLYDKTKKGEQEGAGYEFGTLTNPNVKGVSE